MNVKMTIADRIAERIRGWTTECGTHLVNLCERLAEDVKYVYRDPRDAMVTTSYRMADGSSIVVCGDWWDVEVAE